MSELLRETVDVEIIDGPGQESQEPKVPAPIDYSAILGGQLGSAVNGEAFMFVSSTTTVALSIGDVVTTAGHPTIATRMTKATAAALAASDGAVHGIVLLPADALGAVVYATVNSIVPNASLGVTPPTKATWLVLNTTTGRGVIKDAPEVGDYILGEIAATTGNLHFNPYRFNKRDNIVVVTDPPFGAKGDASVDDSDAIRSALAQTPKNILLNSGARILSFPAGVYTVNKPIHVKYTGGNTIRGEGDHAVHLRSITHVGPSLYLAPDRGEFPHDTNQYAGGSAAIFKSTQFQVDTHYLQIGKYGAGHWLHGKSAFSIEAVIKIDTPDAYTDNGITFILVSYGRRFQDEGIGGLAEAYALGYSGSSGSPRTNAVFLTLTTTSGIMTVMTPNSSLIADGNYHKVEANWSSGQMRIFIDGVAQTLSASGALAGTVVQKDFESVILGGGAFARHYGAREVKPTDCHVASLRISNIARNTTGYTPPVAKYTNDANTMLLLNFDTYDGVFVIGDTRPQTNSTSTAVAYWPHRRDEIGTAQAPNIIVENMFIENSYGIAIDCDGATRLQVRNVETLGKQGIAADNNCYTSSLKNVKCLGSNSTLTLPQTGISVVGAGHVFSMTDCYVHGFNHNLVIYGAGDVTVQGSWYSAERNDVAMLFLSCSMVTVMGDVALGDEASPAATQTFLGVIACDYFNAAGLQFGQSVAAAGPLVTIEREGAFPPGTFDISGQFMSLNTCPGLVKVLGTVTGEIRLRGTRKFSASTVPTVTSGSTSTARVVWEPSYDTTGSIVLTDADKTLTRDEHMFGHHEYSGTLTATRTVTWPAFKARKRSVYNGTAQTLNFKLAGGAVTIAVPTLTSATFAVNNAGTELVKVGA